MVAAWIELGAMTIPLSPVLVVDDDPRARGTAVELLRELGVKVFDAYNGATALHIMEQHPEIRLLLVDVRMPGMRGPELADLARKLRPELKVVLMSGYMNDPDVPSHVSFVPKPLRLDILTHVLMT